MKFGDYYFEALPSIIYGAYKTGDTVTLMFFGLPIVLKLAEFQGLLALGKLQRKI